MKRAAFWSVAGFLRNAERRDIATEYSKAVDGSINSVKWQDMPAPEDQLPDDWMPKSFFEYWSGQPGTP
jgi:hypothetical protein